MKRKFCLLFSFVVLLCCTSTAFSKKLELTQTQLLDKIKGAWAGQTIGCSFGGPVEFKYQGKYIPEDVALQWNEHTIRNFFDKNGGLYDDVYMDLTFVDVFERLGLDAPVDSFALAFANAPYMLWHANQAARYNILHGIMPPESGFWKNNPHADCIDFQIEADFAGIMSPAMPQVACGFADKIGHIMNYGDGWYGGVYVAAMYSLAFVYDDVEKVVTEALRCLPVQSNYRKCIEDVILWYHQNPSDWHKTWDLCQKKYSGDVGCPEGVMGNLDIDASLNGAYVVMGLLYGQGDFERTLDVSTRCGQDADCNPATAGGILATILGYSKVPEKWMAPLREVEGRPFTYTQISLNRVYEMSLKQAREVIESEGGKVEEEQVQIKIQAPKPVRYEKSFEGLAPLKVEKYNPQKNLQEDLVLNFEGAGVVVAGGVKAPKGYVAELEMVLDGLQTRMLSLPADGHDRKCEVYWNYDLKPGSHQMVLRWLNPLEKAEVYFNRLITYKKEQ